MLLVCAKCAGVFISRAAELTSVAPAFSFKSHFFLFIFNAFCYMPSEWPLRLSSALQSFVAFCFGRTGCAPPNAPYVEYTDERGQVTSARARYTPPRASMSLTNATLTLPSRRSFWVFGGFLALLLFSITDSSVFALTKLAYHLYLLLSL